MFTKSAMRPFWFNTNPDGGGGGGGGGGAPPAGAPPADAPPADAPPAGAPPADAPPADAPPAGAPPAGAPPADAPPADAPPADWRAQIADEKVRGLADRFTTPAELAKAYKEATDKIRSGQLPKGLPEGASEEEVAEYRKELGVPESADKYLESLSEGTVLGDEDKAILNEVFSVMHDANVPAEVAAKQVDAFLASREKQIEQRYEKDRLQASEADTLLKEQWGTDFDTNKNMVGAFLNGLPGELKDDILSARLPNGDAIFNNATFVDFLAKAQRQINPMAAVVPGGGSDSINNVEAEMQQLESKMGTPEWYADTAAQQRYQILVDARDFYKAEKKRTV